MNLNDSSNLNRLRIYTDRVIMIYLLIIAALVLVNNQKVSNWTLLVSLHFGGALLVSLLSRRPAWRNPVLSFIRDWYPVPLFLVFYKEVEYLAMAFGDWSLTEIVRQWDQVLFSGQPSIYLSEAMPWLFFSEYIHFCYFFHNIQIPLIGGYFYATNRLAFRELILLVCVTLCASYVFYILFPVDSPFYLSPPLKEPLSEGVLYKLVHFASERGGARGGAFPSSHVSVSTVIWLVIWSRQRKLAILLLPITIGLIFATVYGRFHYVVDSIVGFILAAAVFAVYWFRFRQAEPDMAD